MERDICGVQDTSIVNGRWVDEINGNAINLSRTSILDNIGHTPLINITSLGNGQIFAKAEMFNPGGSIKDRIAKHMIEKAENIGRLKPGGTIIEATSGNTGIGLAFCGCQKGYQVKVVMPENMSMERKKIILALGGEYVLTPAEESLEGALRKARSMRDEIPDAWIPQQFENPDNPEAHFLFTGPEILEQMHGELDSFVMGVGSGGTLAGVGRYLKEQRPNVRIVAVEPKNISALLGHEPGLHQIQGIGDGFVPTVLDTKILNHVVEVTDEEALEVTRKLMRQEGLLVGPSSGANVYAAAKEAAFLGPKSRVVTILPDRAERYFSTSLL